MKHVVLLSGGLDSACLLAYLQYSEGICKDLECLFIDYNQRNAKAEYEAASRICAMNVVPLYYIRVDNLFAYSNSTILKNVEGKHNVLTDELPNRNATLISIAAANITDYENAIIYVGAHKTSAPYADAKPRFYRLMNKLIRYSTNGRISVKAPFIHLTKLELATLGKQSGMMKIEFDTTVSCYEGRECGVCPACIQRAQVIKKLFR